VAGLAKLGGMENFFGGIRADGQGVVGVSTDFYPLFEDVPVLPWASGYENVRQLSGQPLRNRKVARIAPSIAGDAVLRMPGRALDRGQRIRVHLLAALASPARYLVLDPSATVAPARRERRTP
jgi:ABC-type nitrate/sulfonate/bicarbonate transport system ATPase subunit